MALFAEYQPGRRSTPPPADLRIRDATAADVPALVAIRLTRGNCTAEEAREGLERSLALVPEGEVILLVAETEGAVAGYASAGRFEPPPDAPHHCVPAGWYLSGVVVAPAQRRRGIAAKLTRARLDRLTPPVYYFASARNRASIALHEPFGFREVTREIWHPHATFTGGVGILFVR